MPKTSFLSRQFDLARVKFAFIYLLISGAIIIVFTIAAMSAQHYALNRVLSVLDARAQQSERQVVARLLGRRLEEFDAAFKQRLLVLNVVLSFGAAIASYVLSGYSLRSVRENVEKQEEFAADASHELRTPLTTILMEIVALQKTQKRLPVAVSRTLTSIQQEVVRMQQIVSGLLTLVREDEDGDEQSRADGYQSAVSRHLVDVNVVAADVVRQMLPLARVKQLKLSVQPAETAQRVRLSAEKVKQLCLILVDNAIKYTPAGHVQVSVAQSKKYVVLTVGDSGVGIPEADLPRVFDRFYRVHHQTSESKGAGLGLTIAKKLVEAAKGTIVVHSQLGKGTTVEVRLPRG